MRVVVKGNNLYIRKYVVCGEDSVESILSRSGLREDSARYTQNRNEIFVGSL